MEQFAEQSACYCFFPCCCFGCLDVRASCTTKSHYFAFDGCHQKRTGNLLDIMLSKLLRCSFNLIYLKFLWKEEILQEKAAEALAELISHCISRRPSPNDKLIKNICNLTCLDPSETPQATVICSIDIIDDQDLLSFGRNTGKQKSKVHVLAGSEDRSKVEGFISRRGSELALRHLCEKFGASLFDKLPKLWDCLTEVLKPSSIESLSPADEKKITQAMESVKDPQILINNIQVRISLDFVG